MAWLIQNIQRLISEVGRIFSTPMFEIGDNHYSLSLILTLIIIILAVFWASRLVSGGIKRGVLVRFGLDRGTREVISAFIQYTLTVLGFIIVLQTAGVNLSSLTLVAGVVGIGLGFGLQNLASNFISGLTLLFEQSIRVGDFIEVEDLLGTVENISIRSTTVKTLDGLVVVAPNVRFVENNVINWTHRDSRCRIRLPVGVAYGSDTLLVSEVLLDAARKCPRVLTDPPPRVWFCGFGDSALEFQLLVWIDEPAESEPIKSSLYFLMERELRAHHLEIPFPQRDLHIRTPFPRDLVPQKNGSPVTGSTSSSGSENSKPLAPPRSPNRTLRELLRRVSYFQQCSDAELLELIEYGYRQLFAADQIVCEEGTPGDAFYIILTGSVEIFSRRTEQYIATLNQGEFFGEMSLLMGIPRSASVRTVEDTVLFVIERSNLQNLLETYRGLADQIAQHLLERQEMLQDMGVLSELSEETPMVRIRKRLQTLFGI